MFKKVSKDSIEELLQTCWELDCLGGSTFFCEYNSVASIIIVHFSIWFAAIIASKIIKPKNELR